MTDFQLTAEIIIGYLNTNLYCEHFIIPEKYNTIEDYAFSVKEHPSLNRLKKITFNSKISSVPHACFYLSYNLLEIELNNKIESIGFSAFYGCTNLKSVLKVESVKEIGFVSFKNCYSLEKLDFVNIEKIDSYAFENCMNLNSIGKLNCIKSIGKNTTLNAPKIEHIVKSKIESLISSEISIKEDGILTEKDTNEEQLIQKAKRGDKKSQLLLAENFMYGRNDFPINYFNAYIWYNKLESEKALIAYKKYLAEYLKEQKFLNHYHIFEFYENYNCQKFLGNIEKIKVFEDNFIINEDYKKIIELKKIISELIITPFVSWHIIADRLSEDFLFGERLDFLSNYNFPFKIIEILEKHLRLRTKEEFLDDTIEFFRNLLKDSIKKRDEVKKYVKENKITNSSFQSVKDIEKLILDDTGTIFNFESEYKNVNDIYYNEN